MIDYVIKNYFPNEHNFCVRPYGNGHINDTFIVEFPDLKSEYILQRINTSVFKCPEVLISNHLKLQSKLLSPNNSIRIAELIPLDSKNFLFVDKVGGTWRMTSFIKNSYSIDIVNEKWQAYQSGKGFGWFVKAAADIKPDELKEPIKDFHRLSFRIKQLSKAINDNKANRVIKVKTLIDFFKDREESLSQIEQLIKEGCIPVRVVHNDTKINNVLFRNKEAIAVIDLDTAGPGSILFDYGDALRTSANTAAEDERKLEKVNFNMEAFKAFNDGYLSEINGILTDDEKKNLFKAPVYMTYVMGIRFLADYLNGDIYYKTNYIDQNLDRCKVQKKLIESIESNELIIKNIINEKLSKIE